jgi:hypothetical protein
MMPPGKPPPRLRAMARIFAAARPRAPVCVMRWPSDLVHANSSSASDRQTHLSGVLPSSMMD